MSEFGAILEVLSTVVTFVFEATLDVVCGSFMLVACAAVWNIPRIIEINGKNQSRGDWRVDCIGMLLTAVVDFILVPLSMLIVFSPARWGHVLLLFRQGKNNMDLRGNLGVTALCSGCDVVAYLLGLPVLLSPFGRPVTIWKALPYYFRENIQNDFDDRYKSINKLSQKIAIYGLASLVDWLLVLILVPFLIFTPSVWGIIPKGYAFWTDPAKYPEESPTTSYRYLSKWKCWYETLWTFMFSQLLHCWWDMLHAPCFVVVMLSPLRQPEFRRIMREKAEAVTRTEQRCGSDRYRMEGYDFYYSHELREECRHLAFLAIADLLLFPMLLPLWLTQYRYRGLRSKLWGTAQAARAAHEVQVVAPAATTGAENAVIHVTVGTDDQQPSPLPPQQQQQQQHVADGTSARLGLEEFFLISAQAGLLFTDVFFLLFPLPLLFLTRYRWAPVQLVLRKPDVFLEDTSTLYATVLGQLSMMILDLVLTPLAVVILITLYRAKPLLSMLSDTRVLNREGLRFHWAIVANLCIILHDAFLLLPAVLLLPMLLVGYRAPLVVNIVTSHLKRVRETPAPAEATAAPLPFDPHAEVDIYPRGRLRSRLWRQCLSSLIDIPFAILFLVVLGTGWRAAELFANVRYVLIQEYRYHDDFDSFGELFRHDNRVRKCVLKQFCYLGRDVLHLLPCCLVLGTLYRAPQLLGQLFAALWQGGMALGTAPVLEVESCHVEFPMRGGPRINFALRKDHVEPAAPDEGAARESGPVLPGPTIVGWDTSAKVELHMVADSLWARAEQVLGKFLVSLVRSYLPLKLVDGEGVGWAQFTNDFAATTLLADGGGTAAATAPPLSLWLRLNFGTTKRTTILKKLRLFDPTDVITLQLEACAHFSAPALEGAGQGVTPAAQQATVSTRQKVVLLRVHPRVSDLITILSNTADASADVVSGTLPVTALREFGNPAVAQHSDPLSPQAREGNFVNSFHKTVQQVALEVLIDLAVLLAFLLTLLSPLRFVRMLVGVLERESALPGRICSTVLRSVRHLDNHLLEYRRQVAGPVNLSFKEKLAAVLTKLPQRYEMHSAPNLAHERGRIEQVLAMLLNYGDGDVSKELKRIEQYHLSPYQSLCKSTKKALSYFGGCEDMERLLTERLALHEDAVLRWNLRAVAGVLYRELPLDASLCATAESTTGSPEQTPRTSPVVQVDRPRFELVQLVLIEEGDRVSRRLAANEANMMALVHHMNDPTSLQGDSATNLSCGKRWKQCLRQCGLLTRSIDDTRRLIALSFMQALGDVGFMLLFTLLLVTLVRTLPVLQELRANRAWSPLRYTTRWILIKHVKLLAEDLKQIAKFLFFTSIVVITVGGIPSFLVDLADHLGSWYEAAKCAKKHAANVFENILSLLLLLTAFRTYRIALKSSLYCAIIPGACLAEAFPLPDLSATVRFTIGMLVWVALLVGAIVVNVGAADKEDGQATEQYTDNTRAALLGWCAALFGVLFVAALSVAGRPAYNRPDCHAVRSPQMTWDHLLAVLTGPIESVQLSAVVLYFFWDFARGREATQVDGGHGKGVLTTLGADTYAAALLVWSPSPNSDGGYDNGVTSTADGSSSTGFRSSLMVASLLVICWSILVAAPIAMSAAERSRRTEKVLAMKNSPFYEFLMIALSRLLTVWIIATLMRSASCVHVADISDPTAAGYAVLSTAQRLICGDGDWWAAVASLPLLAYYMLTSSVLHADDADLLRSASATNQAGVKFAPFYALCVRAAQFFVCAACFAGFYAHSSLMPLVPILVMVVLMALLPLGIRLALGQGIAVGGGVSGQVCSVSTIAVLRSAGFLCVAWTAIVCIVRSQGGNTGIFTSETTVYVGWGVIYAVALAAAVWEDHQVRRAWQLRIEDSGLAEATKKVMELVRGASVSESVHGERICCPSADANGAIPLVTRRDATAVAQSAMDRYARQLAQIRSYRDLAVLLLKLEQSVLCSRESTEFLTQRQEWIQELTLVAENLLLDETLALEALHVGRHSVIAGNSHRKRVLSLEAGFSRTPYHPTLSPTGPSHSGGAVDQSVVAALRAHSDFMFSVNSCERAVQATGGAGIEAAFNWLLDHVHDPDFNEPLQRRRSFDALVVEDLEQGAAEDAGAIGGGGSTAVGQITSPSSVAEVVPDAHPAVIAWAGSPGVQRLLTCVDRLQRGISTSPSSTHLSRQVLTILMSRKLPSDVCWLIFSYTVSSQDIKRILLDRTILPNDNDNRAMYYDYHLVAPTLTVKKERYSAQREKTNEYLRYGAWYLRVRQQLIIDANIAV